jgi:ATP-binding cassette subfamily C protein
MSTQRIPQYETSAWENFLAELDYAETSLINAGSNRPFLLDDHQKIWIVHTGKVDVFAVQVRDGEAAGVRRHLFRAEAGSLLMGMDLKSYRRNMGLLAVGVAGTTLFPIERGRLETLAQNALHVDSASALLNTWVNGLSFGLAHNMIIPRQLETLEVNQETKVGIGTFVRPKRGIVWVSVSTGIARFMGWEELPLMGDDDYLPVSEHTWLQAVGVSVFNTLDTQTFLKQKISWSCLENFHRMVLDVVIWNVERDENVERNRLKARSVFDERYVETALNWLATILRSNSETLFMPNSGIEEPIVTACRMVGNAIGMPIQARPDPVDGQAEAQTFESITTASRIRTRRVALRGDWWQHDNGPLLAFIQDTHDPVALLSVSTNHYELHNPVDLTRKTVTPEVAARLEPFAYSFYRPFPDQKLRGRDVLRFGLYGSRRDLLMVLLMGIAGGILGIIPPIIMGRIFDTIIPHGDHIPLFLLAAILFAGALASALFQITRGIATLRLESKLDSSIQAAVWDRLLQLPVPFFRGYTAGDLSARASGISTIRQAVSGTVVQSILSGVFSVFYFVLLFFIDSRLALLATLLVLIAIIATLLAGFLQARHQRELANVQGRISGVVLQIITGISKLRIAGVEGRVFAFWAKEFSVQRSLNYKTRAIGNSLTVFNSAFTVLAPAAIFAMAYYAIRGQLSTGSFVAFLATFNQFLFVGLQLSSAFIALLRIVPVYQRAQPILQATPEVNETKADPGELSGDIEMSRLSFRYKEKSPLVLDNVSLHIKRGEFVALVGASGSGKSTLLRLLLGFETPEAGAIFYDGRNLNGLDIRRVRQQLGVVLQNSQLITGDILNNIIGQSNLTIEDAWRAARMAGLEADIQDMPMEMHTFISAGSGTLSGGQRQRLLIARAIARNPRILLFDEATSALDNETQAIVSKSLETLDATRIVIAHRLSTIMSADRIIVFDKGRIIQEGTYAALMEQQDGLFAELARRQLA